MTAAGADMARAGVGCSGWLFEPVMGKRAEGTPTRPALALYVPVTLWLVAGCSEKTGWKKVFFKPLAEAASIFMIDLFQAHDFIRQITINL